MIQSGNERRRENQIEKVPVSPCKTARIHASDTDWKSWIELKNNLPASAVQKLKRYIVRDGEGLDGYETPQE